MSGSPPCTAHSACQKQTCQGRQTLMFHTWLYKEKQSTPERVRVIMQEVRSAQSVQHRVWYVACKPAYTHSPVYYEGAEHNHSTLCRGHSSPAAQLSASRYSYASYSFKPMLHMYSSPCANAHHDLDTIADCNHE